MEEKKSEFDEDTVLEVYDSKIKEFDRKHLGLMSEVMKNIKLGSDLFRTPAPIFLISPASMLEWIAALLGPCSQGLKMFQDESEETRFLSILFTMLVNSSKSPKIGLAGTKPYNPILGEQFACNWNLNDGSTTEFYSEQISHHPPITAWSARNEANNYLFSGWTENHAKFHGNWVGVGTGSHGLQIDHLKFGDQYIYYPPETVVDGLFWGTQQIYLYGKAKIKSDKNMYCTLDFKTGNLISGEIFKDGEKIMSLDGDLCKEIFLTRGDKRELWIDVKSVPIERFNKLGPSHDFPDHHSRKVWRSVTEAIMQGNYDKAHLEKTKVEEQERDVRKEREKTNEKWVPKLFELQDNDWVYKGYEKPKLKVEFDQEKTKKWFFF